MKYPKYHVSTDSVDIRKSQIGIHALNCDDREFCVSVNHKGTTGSVSEATRIARLLANAPEMLEAAKILLEQSKLIRGNSGKSTVSCSLETIQRLETMIAKSEGGKNV